MISIKQLEKKIGNRLITKNVCLEIPEKKITCIIGRSGEGKSLLLKQMIGLVKPTSGSIVIDGIDITQLSEHTMRPVFKKCGYVFQFAALIDSLTVYENMALAIMDQPIADQSMLTDLVKEKLALVNLSSDIMYRYPSELSGGMKKRVGIARTLMHNPTIIFFDEPTTGLDPINARIVHELIRSMVKNNNITAVVVSHDPEIFEYVDYVAMLHEGEIKFFGDAKTIWQSDNPYIYQFIRGLDSGPIYSDIQTNNESAYL